MEVDWVGDTLKVYDVTSCSDIPAYIFVAVLPCSLYGYAEAFPDMKSNHWIEAHIHAYSFFGGVTRILVPDNLKTGVIKSLCSTDPTTKWRSTMELQLFLPDR